MNQPVNPANGHGRHQQHHQQPKKKKASAAEKKLRESTESEIRDVYVAKERPASPEYSRDPKIRKLLMENKAKPKSKSP